VGTATTKRRWPQVLEELRNGCTVGIVLSVFHVAMGSSWAIADEGSTGAIERTPTPLAGSTPKSDRLDQGSCWYAIFFCSLGLTEALRWTERHADGCVIDTFSREFPRLKKGYYCAVEGPSSRQSALDKAQSSKRSGKAPGAYVKEGC
jgi:hypothetical protein